MSLKLLTFLISLSAYSAKPIPNPYFRLKRSMHEHKNIREHFDNSVGDIEQEVNDALSSLMEENFKKQQHSQKAEKSDQTNPDEDYSLDNELGDEDYENDYYEYENWGKKEDKGDEKEKENEETLHGTLDDNLAAVGSGALSKEPKTKTFNSVLKAGKEFKPKHSHDENKVKNSNGNEQNHEQFLPFFNQILCSLKNSYVNPASDYFKKQKEILLTKSEEYDQELMFLIIFSTGILVSAVLALHYLVYCFRNILFHKSEENLDNEQSKFWKTCQTNKSTYGIDENSDKTKLFNSISIIKTEPSSQCTKIDITSPKFTLNNRGNNKAANNNNLNSAFSLVGNPSVGPSHSKVGGMVINKELMKYSIDL